jgi:hypothetical protein
MALEYTTVSNWHQKNRGPQRRRSALVSTRSRAPRAGPLRLVQWWLDRRVAGVVKGVHVPISGRAMPGIALGHIG